MSTEITNDSQPTSEALSFETVLSNNLSMVEGGERLQKLGQYYDWFMSKVKSALDQFKLQLPPKEEVLVIVSNLYDKFVEPIDLPGPDTLLDPLLKNLVLKTTSRMYDQLVNEQLPDNGVPVV